MSDNIKVVVKVRPLIPREIEDKLFPQWRVKNNTLYQIDQNGKDVTQGFTFDKVYDENTKTTDVYEDIAKPIVEAAAAGFNGTIFAYGQTSSGKTYTMTGTEDSLGIIPLSVMNLFDIIQKIPKRDFLVRISYVEIYNETLIDLLNTSKKNIKIQDTLQGVKVDATVRVTTSPEEVLQFMKEGQANRQIGATNMNEESSRSHSIFQITIESREQTEDEELGCLNISQLNLVDLAGSERSGQTGATGLRFKEGTHINKSLTSLALVIKQLSEGLNKHVNYRDSKLTRILQNSLGGNAKTSIICAVTPAAVEETISTLQFASRAKAIKNTPEVNVVATDNKMMERLTKELSVLKTQLENKRNVEEDNQKLQREIAVYQRFLRGFGQHSTLEAKQRKDKQKRRATISTPHIRQEDPVPSVPKFCTPSLKYNPSMIGRPSDFQPVQSVTNLTSVPEEPRLVTPPPRDHRCTVNAIIEIDSDDDQPPDTSSCSPYHKCYTSTKTPPCVLRKVAREKEKELEDLVELTNREKIYGPNVVELIEKLEQSKSVIGNLEETIESLKKCSEENESEVNKLRDNINKAEEEVRIVTAAKLQLEAQCKEYNTKLTDWEVTCDTLKRKAKTREGELLSRLEEFAIMKTKINSDNASPKFEELIRDLKNQLSERDKTIEELNATLTAQYEKVATLEGHSQEMQTTIESYKLQLCNSQDENVLYQSTIKTLNALAEEKERNLESVSNDLHICKNTVQELQDELKRKENENCLSMSTIKTLNSLLDDQKTNFTTVENQLEISNDRIRQIERELKDKENESISQKSTIETVNALLDAHKSKLKMSTNELQKCNDELQQLKLELETKEKENVSHKSGIEMLNALIEDLKSKVEIASKDLHICNETIQQLQDELDRKDEEITLHKSTIQTLNTVVEDQKANLETATNDLQMCNETIQQLQDESDKNEKHSKVTLNDAEVESLIMIEGKIIANNENINNIIQSMKCVIESKNDEIKHLKSNINNEHMENEISNELAAKQVQITELHEKVTALEQQLEDSNLEISNLLQEKKVLFNCVQELNNKISKVQENNTDLRNRIKSFESELTNLRECNESLKSENQKIETKFREINVEVSIEIEKHMSKINSLEVELQDKTNEIDTLAIINHKYVDRINHILVKLNNNLVTLVGDDSVISINIDSSVNVVNTMDDRFDTLETTVMKMLEHVNTFKVNIFKNVGDLLTTQIKSLSTEIIAFERVLNHYINRKSEQSDLNESFETSDGFALECDNMLLDGLIDLSNANEQLLQTNVERWFHNIKQTLKRIKQEYIASLETLNAKVTDLNDLSKSNRLKEFTRPSLLKVDTRINNMHGGLGLPPCNSIDNVTQVNRSDSDMRTDLQKIRDDNDTIVKDLEFSAELLKDLRIELKSKTNEMGVMEEQVLKWKKQFSELDSLMQMQLHDLQVENAELKKKCLLYKTSKECLNTSVVNNADEEYLNTETSDESKHCVLNTPQSLLTITCNKISEHIENCKYDTKSVTSTSNTDVEVGASETSINICECDRLREEVKNLKEKNEIISKLCNSLKVLKKNLTKEITEAKSEIRDLLSYTNELQKKILNHRTNLSTLTATTYAENKLLSSRVKFLQLHHTRFHTVCQRELPELKDQLQELMKILKEENLEHKLNSSFKRYSLPVPLDSNSLMYSFKNESTLDGDMLMLDTNLTVNTSVNNTLTGLDQTCCEVTQPCSYNDVACQTDKLYRENKADIDTVNNATSPFKQVLVEVNTENKVCEICVKEKEQRLVLDQEIGILKQKLIEVSSQRESIEKKYNDLYLEIPATDGLLRKLNNFERELQNKSKEIEKLSIALKSTKELLKGVQEENDNLSTQVMEFVSEIDDLKKELDSKKNSNLQNSGEVATPGNANNIKDYDNSSPTACNDCVKKDEQIKDMLSKYSNMHTRLNRSYSDSDSSSRYNKICTLQNELEAGREDCNELKEEVTTIKKQLENNNLDIVQAMDLDESINEIKPVDETNKTVMPIIKEENISDLYNHEKLDCFNYYVEKFGNTTNLNSDVKIIDLVKIIYSKLTTNYENRIEEMTKKLKEYDVIRHEMQKKINNVTKTLEESELNAKNIDKKISQIRNNINLIEKHTVDSDAIELFKEKVLAVLDIEFSMNCNSIFEAIITCVMGNNLKELNETLNKYAQLEKYSQNLKEQSESMNSDLIKCMSLLAEKENECNLLAMQKAKIHEINSSLVMELLAKDEQITKSISEIYNNLAQNQFGSGDIDNTLPQIEKINILVKKLCNEQKQLSEKVTEIKSLKQSIAEYESILKERENKLKILNEQHLYAKEQSDKELKDKDNKIKVQKSLYDDLNAIYNTKVEENDINVTLIQKLTAEINILKENISSKDMASNKLQRELDNIKQTNIEGDIAALKEELHNVKQLNHALATQKDMITIEHDKIKELLDRTKTEHEKMESDVLVLRESVKENDLVVDSLKREIDSLTQQISALKGELEERCQELSRLKSNIKTHETTAKIQTKMISRLQQQKDKDANLINEKERQLAELNQKCENLQKDSVLLNECIAALRLEVDSLKHSKQTLENNVVQLQSTRKGRQSLESVNDSLRRRRQSIHDATRAIDDNAQDHEMDWTSGSVDEEVSYRSTPVHQRKGRDSLQSKHEMSEDDERPSRPNSAMEARRRRRSTHDQLRPALRTTPDGHDELRKKLTGVSRRKSSCGSNGDSATEILEQLSSCRQELEELKERYKELDDECETCANYLRERDEQCARLKKEKIALEKIIAEQNEKMQNNTIRKEPRGSVAHAAVNTDEDWANLHSVVVDRMSFDAEVEKNKRLTRTIEELRFNKQELKTLISKMQKALEENGAKDKKELERSRIELLSCKEELEEMKRRYKELDEECETCAQYLKEREEQCRRLKETVSVLEAKLQESYENAANLSQSGRRKRQMLHDLNRQPTPERVDASTETGEDLYSRQVEKDNKPVIDDTQAKLIKKLKVAVQRLSEQKATLEQQLMAASTAPVYVATGSAIVQNQQLTDVMKENRKLKKMNAELITLCKKRGKALTESTRENVDPTEEI